MGDLKNRIERLEVSILRSNPSPSHKSTEVPPELDLLTKAVENWRRVELGGLEPIPLTPEEEALSLEADRCFLEEYIPYLRTLGGSPETLAMLDELEGFNPQPST